MLQHKPSRVSAGGAELEDRAHAKFTALYVSSFRTGAIHYAITRGTVLSTAFGYGAALHLCNLLQHVVKERSGWVRMDRSSIPCTPTGAGQHSRRFTLSGRLQKYERKEAFWNDAITYICSFLYLTLHLPLVTQQTRRCHLCSSLRRKLAGHSRRLSISWRGGSITVSVAACAPNSELMPRP